MKKGQEITKPDHSKKVRVKNRSDLIDLIRELDGVTSLIDFESDEISENYINATFMMLRKYDS